MRRALVAMLVAGSMLGAPAPVTAADQTEPILLMSSVEEGQKMDRAPASVTLTFSQPLDPAYTRLEIYDECGKRVDDGSESVTLIQITVPLKRTPKGTYKIFYFANGVPKGATGETKGKIRFRVRKGKDCG